MFKATASIEDIQGQIGREVGISSWVLMDQERINRFADLTNDHNFIHVDPERARSSPFGGTIAHGLLTLSMLSSFAIEALPMPTALKMGVNYGYNRVRFLAPVRSGRRIRGRFKVLSFSAVKPGRWQHVVEATVDIEGEGKPALIAEWVGMLFV